MTVLIALKLLYLLVLLIGTWNWGRPPSQRMRHPRRTPPPAWLVNLAISVAIALGFLCLVLGHH